MKLSEYMRQLADLVKVEHSRRLKRVADLGRSYEKAVRLAQSTRARLGSAESILRDIRLGHLKDVDVGSEGPVYEPGEKEKGGIDVRG